MQPKFFLVVRYCYSLFKRFFLSLRIISRSFPPAFTAVDMPIAFNSVRCSAASFSSNAGYRCVLSPVFWSAACPICTTFLYKAFVPVHTIKLSVGMTGLYMPSDLQPLRKFQIIAAEFHLFDFAWCKFLRMSFFFSTPSLENQPKHKVFMLFRSVMHKNGQAGSNPVSPGTLVLKGPQLKESFEEFGSFFLNALAIHILLGSDPGFCARARTAE